MRRNFWSIFIIVILVLLSASLTGGYAPQKDSASYIRAEHREIIDHWLAHRPDLRLATDADSSKEGLAETRKEEGRNYHPYYAVGDINGDGKGDFAVAFVRKRKSKWPFVLAIFNGLLNRESRPAFITDEDLSDGGFFLSPRVKPREGRLKYGPFSSDDCVIVRPRRKTYVLRACILD